MKNTSKQARKGPSKKANTTTKSKKNFKNTFVAWFDGQNQKRKDFLSRRPHRSFQLTKKRDYKRQLKLPGYISFTNYTFSFIMKHKKAFFGLSLVYVVLAILVSSMMSQQTYVEISDLAKDVSEEGSFEAAVPVLAIFWSVFSNQISGAAFGALGSAQQAIGLLFALLAWLSAIWMTRTAISGQKPKIREAIYSSGSPIVSMIILLVVILIQLMPATIALIAYSSASQTQFLDQTAVLMLFGGGVILMITLTVYWITSTLVAMVIATVPGMYPGRALKLAGDVAVGRRTRLMLRSVWLLLVLLAVWATILVPGILIDTALRESFPVVSNIPIIPVLALGLMSFSIVYSAVYLYMLYRKVLDDDSPPA